MAGRLSEDAVAPARRADHPDVSPEEFARQINIPVKTTAEWRSRGVGPTFTKVGRHVRYRQSDIDAWLTSRTVKPGER